MTGSISSASHASPSPATFSPFSAPRSPGSDLATSDESPDLGAFTTVFRAFQELQPRTFPLHFSSQTLLTLTDTPTGTDSLSPTDEAEYSERRSTVWHQAPVASYLSFSSRSRSVRTPPPSDTPSSETEDGEQIIDDDEDDDDDDDDDDGDEPDLSNLSGADQPTLGGLDSAFEFLAGERARLVALRDAVRGGGLSSTSDAWDRVPSTPRRRRRRKKAKSLVRPSTLRADPDDDASSSSPFPPSSPVIAPVTVSQPATPGANRLVPKQPSTTDTHRLLHARSTPILRAPALDPQVVRLRSLGMKLKVLFPADAERLSAVLASRHLNATAVTDFVDTRGPAPNPDAREPITHIFIDYSNILIGFLTYIRQHRLQPPGAGTPRHLSHAALALALERGRPITRRVLAASSPLYQPMESAQALGYEVHVYARVPDTSDPAERARGHNRRSGGGSWRPIHVRGSSGAGAGTSESEPSSSSGASARVRYREQGVDELLQLKLHLALSSDAPLPEGSTIVLATGDGNGGEFNEEGFVGCVRLALKKRWRVELHAWESGTSRVWAREFGADAHFRVEALDRFAPDLLAA
ncbi:hypothetical protein K488DRAFT_86393 [Vararia minispora EC-137]|uniref:Uncharacterized protein n=1 Tax=Vararia minispora EC-137 TaxID=1314806 RepID=A0ACB8QJL9_9AGAM|nr:hypothetical protein K488DRAFT_86393 [Vararia minispora EC-137]